MKKSVVSLLVLGLVGVVSPMQVLAAPGNSVGEVSAQATTTTNGLFKIDSVTTESVPAGCITGCPLMTKQTPAFGTNSAFAVLNGASKIVTANGAGNGMSSGCAVITSNLWCWGVNSTGRVGNGSTSYVANPVQVLTGVRDVVTTTDFTCAVKTNDALVCAGTGNFGANASWATVNTFSVNLASNVSRVEGSWNGSSAVCVIDTNRHVSCTMSWATSGGQIVWADMGLDNVVDLKVYSNWPNPWVCVANGQAICKSLNNSNGVITFTSTTTIEDITNVEAIYMTSQSLCVYANGALACNGYVWNQNGNSLPRSLKSAGIMSRPINIIYGGSMPYMYIILPTGVLYADSWIFNCTTCYTSGQTISPVTAFVDAVNNQATRTFYAVSAVSGYTDNPDLLPMTVTAGDRIMRSRPSVVISAGGVPISGATVTWASPDNPGQYRSSASGTLTTDASGNPGLPQLPSGPITFTISKGVVNGSYLQAATVTTFVGETGTINVQVPAPAPLINRKVTVINEDGSVVPSAIIAIRNNFLLYNYSLSGADSATWSALEPQTGFNQVVCSMCYTIAPSLITGADGSVTFKSYTPTTRSSRYDVTATYDDGLVSQTMSKVLTSADDSVQLPFLARLETPYIGNLVTDSNGFVTLPVRLVDKFASDLSNLKVAVEEICGALLAGGLWNSANNSSTCSTGAVSAASVGTGGVSAAATTRCGSSSAVTNASGEATIKVCFAHSAYVRIRTRGVVPSKAVCVVVGGKPCGSVSSTPIGTGVTQIARRSSVTYRSLVHIPAGAKITTTLSKSSAKVCTLTKTRVQALRVVGTCTFAYVVTRMVKGKLRTVSKGRVTVKVA